MRAGVMESAVPHSIWLEIPEGNKHFVMGALNTGQAGFGWLEEMGTGLELEKQFKFRRVAFLGFGVETNWA